MKKLLLASAVAALSVSAANAAPTIYGKAFVTMDYVNLDDDARNGDVDSVQINSNSSRIGFKGSEAMTANTDVIYQLEYGINVDGDNGDEGVAFKSRDTFLGVNNKNYGEFRFGRNTSVVDYVNNVVTAGSGFWDNLGSDMLDGDENGINMVDSSRQNNSVIWKAPKYNNLPVDLAVMYKADESFVGDNDDRNNGFAAAAMYDAGTGFTAGVAYDNDVNLTGDLIRGTATVDLGKFVAYPVTLGALYQVADFDPSDNTGDEKEKGLVVSAKMGLNNFAKPAAVYVQYNNTSNVLGLDNVDSDQIVVGGEYAYKPNMIAHAYVGKNSADLNGGDYDLFAAGGGLEYKF